MNELSRLAPPKGAQKNGKRIGRGPGSGTGKTAGRGQKGQKARAASKKMPGFEGGQMPLQRRLPKRGFASMNPTVYEIVNLRDLARFEDGAEVTPEGLKAKGLIRKAGSRVKILAVGTLDRKLTVKAHKFSKAAAEQIVAAGGAAEVLGG